MDLRLRRRRLLAAAALSAALAASAAPAAHSAGPAVSEAEAIRIAKRDANAADALRRDPDLHVTADRADDGDWEVGLFDSDEQLVEVIVNSTRPVVEESWTGDQIKWTMARGYEGAFGRTLNSPWIWIPLCAIFVVGLLDWRRLRRIAHLDLLVLVAGFGLSHYFFNRGETGISVPLAYPPLLYLLVRSLALGFGRGGTGLRPSVPAVWLAVAAVLLVGGRIALNVSDSNVIDVGYAGVIGADRIGDGDPVYGDYPTENHAGDTYGPVAYYAYVPFEQAFAWSGAWDDLPAAHAAAIFFDLAVLVGLFLLGRNLAGPGRSGNSLGATLAFGWAACPYSSFALQSNTNDSLVAALLVAALLALGSAPFRGALFALATATKFAPLALAPLFATYGATRAGGARRRRTVIGFTAAFAAVTVAVSVQALLDPGLATFWDRTVANQAGRESPFSIWGQLGGADSAHLAAKAAVVALAVLVAFRPRLRDPATVAALAAAVMIALQITAEHWFYLYIPWFLPLLLVALLARPPQADGTGIRT